jgi:endonuclease YncB( thermonuclease family)
MIGLACQRPHITRWAPMIIGYKKKPSSSLYFSSLIAACVFIGFAAVQVSSKLYGEQRVTTPAKPMAHAPAPISVHVIGGGTISLNDGRPNVRLVGFNAPETGNRARCEAERKKGEAAGQRLRELVSNGRPDFQLVTCSCPPGTEGTNACNFGRRCGTLRVKGVDVGATLIGEGLAVRFVCGATSCPPLPRPWC